MLAVTPALTGVAIVAAAVGVTVLMWRTRRDRVTVAWVALAVAVVGAAAVAALVPLRILGLDVFGIVHLIYLCAVVSVPLVGLVTLALIPARRATVGAVVGATVLIAAAPLGWYMTHIAPFDMRVETVKVLLPGTDLDEPVRIAVLADLQTAGVGDHERRAIRAVIASDPDIVLIPGDLFQGSDDEFDDEVGELRRLLRDLDAPSGVFVTRGDGDGGDRVDRAIAGSGITILDDRVVQVDVRGTTVRIGGTRLDYESESADLVRRQLASAPADDITILVSHRPGHGAGALLRGWCRPDRRGSHPWRPGVAAWFRTADDPVRCPTRRRRRRPAHDQRQPALRVARASGSSAVRPPRCGSSSARPWASSTSGDDPSGDPGRSVCALTAATRENRDPMTLDAQPVKIGPIAVWPPVVLAPMAGVTDAPFRVLCSEFGRGLYVNQMVTARALVENHPPSWELVPLPPERAHPVDPAVRHRSRDARRSDPPVGRRRSGRPHRHELRLPGREGDPNGGGAALPVKRRLLAAIVRAAVRSADEASGGTVPVTVKFRLGIDDDHLTFLDTGRIAEGEGAAALALHARTALQHYAPPAHWDAIGELKAAIGTIPVFGNGEIFTADDARTMMERTGCDGVVVGRGCLGRPWLFAELDAAFSGEPIPPTPSLGTVASVIRRHVDLMEEWASTGSRAGEPFRLSPFRKHLAWYLKGYPVGAAVRQGAGQVATRSDLERLLEHLDPDARPVEGAERMVRSHANPLRRVALPDRWLDDPDDDLTRLDVDDMVSGG